MVTQSRGLYFVHWNLRKHQVRIGDSNDLAVLYLFWLYLLPDFLCSSHTRKVKSLSRVQLCNPVGCGLQGFPVHHQTPRTCSNSGPSSRWCHPTISSSVVPFSYLQYFPASGSFQMSKFFALSGWPKYLSFSFSLSPSNKYSGLFDTVWLVWH